MASKGQNTGGNGNGSNVTTGKTTKAATVNAKATKANDKAKDTAKADITVYDALRKVDAQPMAKDKAFEVCHASKRAIAAIFAAMVIAGYKVTAVNWLGFANLTAAYRHGVTTDKATNDGDKNNDIYIRHASKGLQGDMRHVWACNALATVADKDVAALVAVCKIDKAQAVKALQSCKVRAIAEFASKIA